MSADVAVIGAGPSGAWTACLLAGRGARVLLVDPSHPREKPCGGGVTGRALSLVAEALPAATLPAVHVRTARFVDSREGTSATVPLPAHAIRDPLVVASRASFDGLLLAAARRAGAELLQVRATDVSRTATGFRIDTADGTVREAAFVVGADGANSLVRRRLGHAFGRGQLSMATGYFAHGLTGDEIVIELVADPPGYIWSFPRPDHLAIGICAAADAGVTSGALRARTAEWIRTTGIGMGARLEPYAWPIPSLSPRDFSSLQVSGPGWCLVGDAAGLVDPITREGIFFALESARFAADALCGSLSLPERRFGERVRAEIVSELAPAARLKDGFFRPRFTRLMIQALAQSAGIRAVMADLIAGTQSYRDLTWRLAKTMEFGVAWKLLRSA
jgi:geranylgeranyl reductase family protein